MGIFVDVGSTGTGTVQNAYGGYFTNPAVNPSVSKSALYADNLNIGYTGVSPPSSGAIISGNICIGASSATNSSLLTLGTTSTTKGISFNNNISGYVPADLHCYEVANSTSYTFQCNTGAGSTGSSSTAVTPTITKVGNVVTLYIPVMTINTGTSPTIITTTTNLPVRFRPNAWSNVGFIVPGIQGSNIAAVLVINTLGTITIYSGVTQSNFTASTSYCGLACDVCVQYISN
jgi:hypothetical protein